MLTAFYVILQNGGYSQRCLLAYRHDHQTVSSDLDKNDLDAWLSHLGLDRDIERITAETKPEKLTASIRRMFASKAPILLSGYDKYYSDGVA